MFPLDVVPNVNFRAGFHMQATHEPEVIKLPFLLNAFSLTRISKREGSCQGFFSRPQLLDRPLFFRGIIPHHIPQLEWEFRRILKSMDGDHVLQACLHHLVPAARYPERAFYFAWIFAAIDVFSP